MNPLQKLNEYGQSVWFDYIRRGLLTSGELKKMVDDGEVRGVTSNPAIFEKAISGSTDYREVLEELASLCQDAKTLFEQVAIRDIRDAADVLRPVYDETKAGDGYVSMEVSPNLARDTVGTVEEARRLWGDIDRPNVMIKVPATEEGIPAIETLISEGINVNVTLLFSQEYYEKAAQAYVGGLRKRAADGGDVSSVASVASFFVSRIDSAVDSLLEEKIAAAADGDKEKYRILLGKTAIANARQAYRRYGEIFGAGEEWKGLASKGAMTQRMLWASTGTKNPAYRDVLYIEELIGPDTVNTVPPATFEAFRDHGILRESLTEALDEADEVMVKIAEGGIDLKTVTDQLLDDGVRLFAVPFGKLLATVEKARKEAIAARISYETYSLPAELDARVKAILQEWQEGGKVRRLWARDASLWTGGDEAKWLGWLGVSGDDDEAYGGQLRGMAEEVRRKAEDSGFASVLLLGMGGSSLCPEVLSETFGPQEGFPRLIVLDSTDPAQIRAVEGGIDLTDTLFIVSSKSGTTLEPNIFKEYFFERVKEAVGPEEAGKRFVAITDPGSKLQETAERDGFRRVRFGIPGVGGRYSALTNFGMVPAAAMGVDVHRYLDRVEEMVEACSSCVPVKENPGVVLGVILGVLADAGRYKVTFVISPAIYDLGAWLEQLLAESTGKGGRGLVPVDLEKVGPPGVYGDDRLFVYIKVANDYDAEQEGGVKKLAAAGQPVVRIEVNDIYDLGQEFFRWEIATAVAGSLMGINPFDQPDVEASKVETKKLTSEYEKEGALPPEKPILTEEGIRVLADPTNAAALKEAMGGEVSLRSCLKAHLDRLSPGDYFALLAFIEMNDPHRNLLQRMRHAVRDVKKTATCLGFGPRFLHSTGQAYKGGPNSGVFLQVTCDDAEDLPIPGHQFTFGIVKAAQARGDFQVLADRGRRVLRVHLGHDVKAGLEKLRQAVEDALA
jgi:transaldolase/glucose-6-phosphate isomerase